MSGLAVLYPAIAEAAHRAEADTIALIDVGREAGANLEVDRVGLTYSSGQTFGDPAAAVQVSARLWKDEPLPERAFPQVVARLTAAGTDQLTESLALIPLGVLPVVTTSWALSKFSRDQRLRFLQGLDAAATERTVAWVSAEGVAVAPGIPTLGDRPASGHSIVGLALFSHRGLQAEALGRCWSRGTLLRWLAS